MSSTRKDYLYGIMGKHLASVLMTVSRPYSVQLGDAALTHCLAVLDLAKQHPGHVSAFSVKSPRVAGRVRCGASHLDPELKAFAAAFSAWSGESYLLAA